MCRCNDFVDENGIGACQKRDANFGGAFSCFVHESATCIYIEESTNDTRNLISPLPCKEKNESNVLL